MNTGFQVVQPGVLSLVQDAGRFGWQHLGVSPSGPVDRQAAAWANHLLGNPWGTAVLEVALGGLQLKAKVDTWVAVCGADLPIHCGDYPQALWSSFAVRQGTLLSLGFARTGQRAFLAVAGGFQTTSVLGSRACQRREGLGGVEGRGQPLQAGDWLPCAEAHRPRPVSVPWAYQPDYAREPNLRVIPASGLPEFSSEAWAQLLGQPWRVSPRSDRMGIGLQGEPLSLAKRQWSLGVVEGAIQVPPDGQPIVLMADRQTMGGYPLLGWVHPLDLGRLAQCPPQHVLRFQSITLAEAQQQLRQFYQFFRG